MAGGLPGGPHHRITPTGNDHDRRSAVMQARMKNPGVVIPDAMTAIRALNEAIKRGGVPPRTLDLVHLRPARSTAAACALARRPEPQRRRDRRAAVHPGRLDR